MTKIVAECVDDDNRQRLENAGATLVMRPVRAYPEMIIGGLLNPGSTIILENLFTAEGERIVRSEKLLNGVWSDIVSDYLDSDSGTPIAYRDANTGEIVTAPSGATNITADAILSAWCLNHGEFDMKTIGKMVGPVLTSGYSYMDR